jgi:hypothetical protein
MKVYLMILLFIVSALLTGCATSQGDKAKIPLDSDPRVGAEVQQVCFTHELDGWQNVDNDPKAVIMRMNNSNTFKLKLSASCHPTLSDAGLAIKTSTRSGCFSPGDKVMTSGMPPGYNSGFGSGCIVTSIHKWDAKAVSKTEKS